MGKTRPPYPAAFRTEAVELVRTSGQPVAGDRARSGHLWGNAAARGPRRRTAGSHTRADAPGRDRAGGIAAAAAREPGAAAGAGDPAKSSRLLREGDPVSRFRFIAAEK